MDEINPRPAPVGWTQALDRAEADVAAGRVVDGAEIHAELDASIQRMQRREGGRNTSKTNRKQ